ncbi:hypothetical protein [Paenibacillus sp. MMS18-CY102]|uniref:hypothetical protein n=1 Tax=Paenibacillus sp. MMS18-CY102 TaxID=2682849 RepID=UPI0013AB0427|nr:hypothetical protein [Paenibacillus sp. MMS18-CY102]MWC30449.1 hypothetical protein [Paenibacillus sp. MMS18-CY102]
MDEPLPEQSPSKITSPTDGRSTPAMGCSISEIFSNLVSWAIFGLFVRGLVVQPFLSYEGFNGTVSTSSNTFNDGGTSGGNSGNKSVGDDAQAEDESGEAGFGNSGESGYDAESVGDENSTDRAKLDAKANGTYIVYKTSKGQFVKEHSNGEIERIEERDLHHE